MKKITLQKVKETADELDTGMRCFYNVKTMELLSIIDFNRFDCMGDEELWQDVQEQIDEHWDDLVEINAMESHDSFRVMERYAELIKDEELQGRLYYALRGPNPFRNFKYHIDNSGEYRQKWFDFKAAQYIEWVKEQMEVNDIKIEDE